MTDSEITYGALLVEVRPDFGNYQVLAKPEPDLNETFYAQAIAIDGRYLASFPRLPSGNWQVWVDLTPYQGDQGNWWKRVTIFPGAVAQLVFA